MSTLKQMLSAGEPAAAIAAHLAALDEAARLEQVLVLGKREQATLFERVDGFRAVTLDDLVPSASPLTPVTHEGKNTLPVFSRFAKVFCRPSNAGRHVLLGYNRNPPLVAAVAGDGYFIARPADRSGEVAIDYAETPAEKPEAWPPLARADRGLGALVFGGMVDILRGVTADVSIGRAYRRGQAMDAWFALCRTT